MAGQHFFLLKRISCRCHCGCVDCSRDSQLTVSHCDSQKTYHLAQPVQKSLYMTVPPEQAVADVVPLQSSARAFIVRIVV